MVGPTPAAAPPATKGAGTGFGYWAYDAVGENTGSALPVFCSSPSFLPRSRPQTGHFTALKGASAPHPRQNMPPLSFRPCRLYRRYRLCCTHPWVSAVITLHGRQAATHAIQNRAPRVRGAPLVFVLLVLLSRVNGVRMLKRRLRLSRPPRLIQGLRQRLVADREVRIQRDRRLRHLNRVAHPANLQVGIRQIVTDAGIERVALQGPLIGGDGLVVPAQRVVRRRLLIERLRLVREALQELVGGCQGSVVLGGEILARGEASVGD